MSTMDVFGMTDKLDERLLDVMVTRLEARGQHPVFAKMMQDYLEAMEIVSGKTVLDLGCGTGVAARWIARQPKFTGKVIGIDLSAHLIAAAASLAEKEGVANRVEFNTGDTHALELEDASVEAVVAHTLVSHVDRPLVVIQEAARVVKPGGLVGIFDGDYASLTFDQEDPGKSEEDDKALIQGLVAHPRVMRQMPKLLRKAGLELVHFFPYAFAEVGKANFWASGIEAYSRLVTRSGAMTEEYAREWADNLKKDSEEGVFFGSSNYYAYVARRG